MKGSSSSSASSSGFIRKKIKHRLDGSEIDYTEKKSLATEDAPAKTFNDPTKHITVHGLSRYLYKEEKRKADEATEKDDNAATNDLDTLTQLPDQKESKTVTADEALAHQYQQLLTKSPCVVTLDFQFDTTDGEKYAEEDEDGEDFRHYIDTAIQEEFENREKATETFLKIFEKNYVVKAKLGLSTRHFFDKLCNIIASHPYLQHLSLSEACLSYQEGEILINGLLGNHSLLSLDLERAFLNKKMIKYSPDNNNHGLVKKKFPHSDIRTSNLALSFEEMMAIFNQLVNLLSQESSCLEKLNLAYNVYDNKVLSNSSPMLSFLIPALEFRNCNLKHLDIRQSCMSFSTLDPEYYTKRKALFISQIVEHFQGESLIVEASDEDRNNNDKFPYLEVLKAVCNKLRSPDCQLTQISLILYRGYKYGEYQGKKCLIEDCPNGYTCKSNSLKLENELLFLNALSINKTITAAVFVIESVSENECNHKHFYTQALSGLFSCNKVLYSLCIQTTDYLDRIVDEKKLNSSLEQNRSLLFFDWMRGGRTDEFDRDNKPSDIEYEAVEINLPKLQHNREDVTKRIHNWQRLSILTAFVRANKTHPFRNSIFPLISEIQKLAGHPVKSLPVAQPLFFMHDLTR